MAAYQVSVVFVPLITKEGFVTAQNYSVTHLVAIVLNSTIGHPI